MALTKEQRAKARALGINTFGTPHAQIIEELEAAETKMDGAVDKMVESLAASPISDFLKNSGRIVGEVAAPEEHRAQAIADAVAQELGAQVIDVGDDNVTFSRGGMQVCVGVLGKTAEDVIEQLRKNYHWGVESIKND